MKKFTKFSLAAVAVLGLSSGVYAAGDLNMYGDDILNVDRISGDGGNPYIDFESGSNDALVLHGGTSSTNVVIDDNGVTIDVDGGTDEVVITQSDTSVNNDFHVDSNGPGFLGFNPRGTGLLDVEEDNARLGVVNNIFGLNGMTADETSTSFGAFAPSIFGGGLLMGANVDTSSFANASATFGVYDPSTGDLLNGVDTGLFGTTVTGFLGVDINVGGDDVVEIRNGTTTINNDLVVNGTTTMNSDLYMEGNQIHGVAPGTVGTDAVNLDQLNGVEKGMSKGIAATTAIANIPQVEVGKKYSIGLGYGRYNSESAIAAGASWHFGANSEGIMKVSIGKGGSGETTGGAGASWSW